MSLKNSSVAIKIHKLFKKKLKDKRISKIYKSFEKSLNIDSSFIVAVSGGPDSLALAFLAKLYSIKKNIDSKFFIVDHKLRKESTLEASLIKKVLRKSFINSEILTWKGAKPSTNIQSLARKKRYELLVLKCYQLDINNILLGHHQDDLFENFFIRLLRGSGLKGLISLSKKNKFDNINLLRPLLDQKKEDLVFLSKNVFDFYVQDPSNKDTKYQRIKVRQLIQKLEKDGLDKKKFTKTINNLKSSNNVIKFYVDENLKKNTSFLEKKNKLLLNESFFQQPQEVIFRSFSDSIKQIGKKYYSVRGKKLDKVIKDIEKKRLLRVTLGGCIIEKVNQTVIISKEY